MKIKLYCIVAGLGKRRLVELDSTKLYSREFYSGKDSKGYFIFWKAPKGEKDKKIRESNKLLEKSLMQRYTIPSHWYVIFKGK